MTSEQVRAEKAAEQAFLIEGDALIRQHEVVTGVQIIRAARALLEATTLGAAGCGHTGIACMHFAHLMCCIGRPAKFIPPSEAAHGGMGFLTRDSVMLLVSRGGRTAELLPILQHCKHTGICVIGVTENMESELAKDADIVLPMLVSRETDRYNCQGTTSFAVTCALFDALQAAMIELMDFHNEQFTAVHPGGAVGERLNGEHV